MAVQFSTIKNYQTGSGFSTYNDDFESYSPGALAGQGNWVSCLNGTNLLVISSTTKEIGSTSTANVECCTYVNITCPDNYSVKGTIKSISNTTRPIGVSARCSGSGATSNYYGVYFANNTSYCGLFVVVNGSYALMAATTSIPSVNDIIELVVNGSTITVKRNGSTDTSFTAAVGAATGNLGVYTDTRLTTGKPGITGYVSTDATTSNNIDTFQVTAV